MEVSFNTDGTYELTSWRSACDEPEVWFGVWTAVDDGFVIEDYYGLPMYGRFLGDRAGALYLDPEGEWIAWSLVRPGAKPWYRPVLFGVRTDDSRLEATSFDDGTCWVKEYSPTCLPLTALDDCTWSLDPVSGLPQLETSEGRYLPSPIGEPGCFHYDDGGLGVDVCVY